MSETSTPDLFDLVREQKEAHPPQPSRRRVTDTDALRFALYKAGREGLTRKGMNDAIGSPNSDRRYRELAKSGEAEKYASGKTNRGRILWKYRLRARTE